jgi:hypothetical protein
MISHNIIILMGYNMEYELEEVEIDYIAFRKEMGEYDIESMRNSTFMVMADTVKSLS